MNTKTLPRVNIIGCGQLGKTIAKLLFDHEAAVIGGVVNTSLDSARAAVAFIGAGDATADIQNLPPADLYFITTKDDQIEPAANALALTLPHAAIIVHCSGVKNSAVLSSLQKRGCAIASVHPVKSFANPAYVVENFQGTFCAMEGDAAAMAFLQPLFEKMGAVVVNVLPEQKKCYHAAGVIANNYLVTLHYHAMQAYLHSGIETGVAKQMASSLMKDALTNLEHLPHEKALTGPIQRGDVKTIQAHLEALQSLPNTKAVYEPLGLATLPLTVHAEAVKTVLEACSK